MPKKTLKSGITPQRVELSLLNRFNPLRNLTYEKLARQLEGYHAGHLGDAARTWEAQERRDIYLGNVASKRKKAVARLSWEILTTEDSEEAKQHAEVLKGFYNSIQVTSVLKQNERGGLSLLIRQMMDAVGKGFAVHEIVWKPGIEGYSAEFLFCPLWWFENRTGRLRYLKTEAEAQGDEMPAGEWLVTAGEGIMESCSIIKLLKDMPLKDWAAFSEKFGMPGVLGKTSATPDSVEWKAMETAVASLINDWAGVASLTDTIELLEAKSGGSNLPFPPLIEYCDRAMAARWRGADLSTISQGKEGSGASLQGDETTLILEDDAGLISETLNEQVDRFVLGMTFRTEPKAYIKLIPPNTSDTTKDLSVDSFFIKNGIPLGVTDVYERYGREVPEDGEEVVTPPPAPEGTPFGNSALANSALSGVTPLIRKQAKPFAEATREVFKPVAERLQRIYALENEAMQRIELTQLLAEIPHLTALVNKSPQNSQALEEALLAGFKKGQEKRK